MHMHKKLYIQLYTFDQSNGNNKRHYLSYVMVVIEYKRRLSRSTTKVTPDITLIIVSFVVQLVTSGVNHIMFSR